MPNDQITLDEITAALDQLATDVLSNEHRPSAEELHARLCAIAAAVREVSAQEPELESGVRAAVSRQVAGLQPDSLHGLPDGIEFTGVQIGGPPDGYRGIPRTGPLPPREPAIPDPLGDDRAPLPDES